MESAGDRARAALSHRALLLDAGERTAAALSRSVRHAHDAHYSFLLIDGNQALPTATSTVIVVVVHSPQSGRSARTLHSVQPKAFVHLALHKISGDITGMLEFR